ncbi:9408_t:CDS:1, partial [Racocetra persica]
WFALAGEKPLADQSYSTVLITTFKDTIVILANLGQLLLFYAN